MTRYTILRDDGRRDDLAGRVFASCDEAYAVLERDYGDHCCSEVSRMARLGTSAMEESLRVSSRARTMSMILTLF